MTRTLNVVVCSALAGLAMTLTAQAQERKPYPEGQAPTLRQVPMAALPLIYQFSGVRDSGHTNTEGIATSIHCTNFSAADAQLRVQLFGFEGTLAANSVLPIPGKGTRTFSTHDTAFSVEDLVLFTGSIDQGSGKIFASTKLVACTAQVLDAGSFPPSFVTSLHMVRFQARPGTQE